ncbi:hypothetical protein ACLOJK_036145 [Asimina triloba]
MDINWWPTKAQNRILVLKRDFSDGGTGPLTCGMMFLRISSSSSINRFGQQQQRPQEFLFFLKTKLLWREAARILQPQAVTKIDFRGPSDLNHSDFSTILN